MTLLHKIEHYLRRTDTPPTRFGREAAGDPRLVLDLRRGRRAGHKLEARITRFLAAKGAVR